MDSRNMFAVGAKLLGIYFLVSGLVLAPGTVLTFVLVGTQEPELSNSFAWLNVTQTLIYLIAGTVLIVAYHSAGLVAAHLQPSAMLVGLRLLAVYFVVSGLAFAVSQAARAFITSELVPARLWPALGGIVSTAAGLILWPLAVRLSRHEPPNQSFKADA